MPNLRAEERRYEQKFTAILVYHPRRLDCAQGSRPLSFTCRSPSQVWFAHASTRTIFAVRWGQAKKIRDIHVRAPARLLAPSWPNRPKNATSSFTSMAPTGFTLHKGLSAADSRPQQRGCLLPPHTSAARREGRSRTVTQVRPIFNICIASAPHRGTLRHVKACRPTEVCWTNKHHTAALATFQLRTTFKLQLS